MIPNDTINDHLITIDISSPEDLFGKLDICFDKEKIEKIVLKNYDYYKLVCDEEDFKINYEKILDEFSKLIERWK